VTTLSTEQRIQRLEVRLRELALWRVQVQVPLVDWRFDGKPLAVGEPWPDTDGVHVLSHAAVDVPDEWPLDEVRVELELGGESLARVDYADGTYDAFGVDPNHWSQPLRGRRFDLRAEAVARLPFGVPRPNPRITMARIARIDPPVELFHRRLRTVLEAARALPGDEVTPALLAAGERALARVTWPSATAGYLDRIAPSRDVRSLWSVPFAVDPQPAPLTQEQRASVVDAAEQLAADLDALRARYPKRGAVSVTGHAHIDLAWLWPLEETRRKDRRTFWSVVSLLDRHPEFRFVQSMAQHYEFVEQDDPDLFARIREKVAAGTWEPVGGMWVECDANLPSGESLVRQLLYAQRYFEDHFGSRHTVCWLPDCFGFTPALPQLLRGAGIDSFFTIKLTWSETNRFPYDLFWWEGLDGTRVLAHLYENPGGAFANDVRVTTSEMEGGAVVHSLDTLLVDRPYLSFMGGYNGDTGPITLLSTWRNFRAKHANPEVLLSIGYGDGGGGPTHEMVEQGHEVAHLPVVPEVRYDTVGEFFARTRERIESSGVTLPAWVGELYLEFHRGTLTTQSAIKRLHRRAEHDLVAAETVAALDAMLGGTTPTSLTPQWKVLLRNQFHDILPGSSIREVNETAEAELAGVVAEAAQAIDGRLDALAGRLVGAGSDDAYLVVNPHLSTLPLRIESAHPLPGSQPVEGGFVTAGGDEIAGLEARVVVDPIPVDAVIVDERELRNAFVRVVLGEDGTLAGVEDLRAGRQVLTGSGNQLWVYVDKPRLFDAWDIDPDYGLDGEPLGAPESIEVVERGPHRGAIRVEWRYRDSRVRQDVRLWSNSARVELRTTLDWHDRRLLLKTRFPVAVRSTHASFETAFGVIERPTHRNTSWDAARFEVCAHRFVDLSEPGYGVALVNEAKYGHHAHGSELGLSLVRSPTHPDPLADEGRQVFTYALFPHSGSWLEGGVLAESQELNRPLLARPVAAAGPASWRPLRLDGLPVALGTLKVLEDDGGLVLRTYEPAGGRGRVEPAPPPGWTIDAELDLLEDEVSPADFSFTPFQVHSWRLRPA
jgi:alpha-mannosidase